MQHTFLGGSSDAPARLESTARRMRFPSIACVFVIGALVVGVTAQAPAADSIKASLQRATEYLRTRQNPDGGYGPISGPAARVEGSSDVGITSLVLYALARQPTRYKAIDGPFISRAVDFLLERQQPDGGIYDPRDPVLKNYRTSVAILALSAIDPELYREPIERARRFVEQQQYGEDGGYDPEEHISYGGFGYGGSSVRPDLSNSGLAADAMRAAGVSASAPLWRRLEVFASRCQNNPEVDPLLKRAGIGTTGDWGFRYAPTDTRGPVESIDGNRVFSSYGSMTYQGLKALLYAGVSRDDPRVKNAFEWISRNFNVRENPGMATPGDPDAGLQGYYYYVHVMAKALTAFGQSTVVDERGRERDWARELSQHLIALQKPDGYWVNEADRWWEGLPEIPTTFAMVSLTLCEEEFARRKRESEVRETEPKADEADAEKAEKEEGTPESEVKTADPARGEAAPRASGASSPQGSRAR